MTTSDYSPGTQPERQLLEYVQIPGELFTLDLTGTAIRVYATLLRHDFDQDGIVKPTEKTIASITGIPKRTVERAIASLAAAGVIRIKHHGRNNNEYHLRYRVKAAKSGGLKGAKTARSGDQTRTKPARNGDPVPPKVANRIPPDLANGIENKGLENMEERGSAPTTDTISEPTTTTQDLTLTLKDIRRRTQNGIDLATWVVNAIRDQLAYFDHDTVVDAVVACHDRGDKIDNGTIRARIDAAATAAQRKAAAAEFEAERQTADEHERTRRQANRHAAMNNNADLQRLTTEFNLTANEANDTFDALLTHGNERTRVIITAIRNEGRAVTHDDLLSRIREHQRHQDQVGKELRAFALKLGKEIGQRWFGPPDWLKTAYEQHGPDQVRNAVHQLHRHHTELTTETVTAALATT